MGKTFHFHDKRLFCTRETRISIRFWFHVPLEHRNQDVFVPVRRDVYRNMRCALSNFIFRAYDAGELWTITRHRVDTRESVLSVRKLLTWEASQSSIDCEIICHDRIHIRPKPRILIITDIWWRSTMQKLKACNIAICVCVSLHFVPFFISKNKKDGVNKD